MIARLGLVLGVLGLQGLAAMSGIGDFCRGSGSGSGSGCPDYIYTVQIETSFEDRNAAERSQVDSDLTDMARDGRLRALWLEQFSGAAGGALFTVVGGNAESAFNRIVFGDFRVYPAILTRLRNLAG